MSDLLFSLQQRRFERYYPTAQGHIHTMEEALEYINAFGFCLFSYIPGVELPSLQMAGCQAENPDIWAWKDSLPGARKVFYGAIFHPVKEWAARPGFVSLEMLAPLYSLAPILQFGGDRALLNRYMKVSREAIAIANALDAEGSLPTKELRASTGLTGKTSTSKFSRALSEAQNHFLVTKVGVTSTTRANYGYVWNTFERVFPEIAQIAEALPESEAAAAILRQYMHTALAAPVEGIAQMLKIDLHLLHSTAARLITQGELCEVEDGGARYLVSR